LKLDTEKIVADLKTERDRLDRAIAALEETNFRPSPSKSRPLTKPLTASKTQASTNPKAVDRLTEERRRRRSEAMKKSWAERRKKA
jgi:hypothetical protein